MTNYHRIVLLLLIWALNFSLVAQTTINGKVISAQNDPIAGANIYVQDSYDGTSSDENGHYSFATTHSGSIVLIASFIGFQEFRQVIEAKGTPISVDIILQEDFLQMGTIVITAGSFEAGTQNKSEVLQALDIVTTAGATADITGALNTLPGTQTVGEAGRLFVRGGDGYETTTFIDGMLVLEPYDIRAPNVPTRSRFSPFMFKGTSFSTGGYSAEYGQGLSSALVLNTKGVATETRTDLSIISVGLEGAHTQMWKEASLAGKIGYFNLDPYYKTIKQHFDWIDPPTSLDGNMAYRQKLGKNGILKSYGKFNFSDMSFKQDPFTSNVGLIETKLRNQYGHLNTSYKNVLSDHWMLRTGAAYTYSNDDITLNNDLVNERSEGLHIKSVAGYEHNEMLYFRVGGELISRTHFQDFEALDTGFKNKFEFSENIISGFAETEWYLTRSVLARLGGRMEYNSLNAMTSLDPRLSLALKTGEYSQLSMAYGKFRQSSPGDLLRVAPGLKSEKAAHFIINYQMMRDKRAFRIEAYWKQYNDLVRFDPELPFLPASYDNKGDGYARGIDIFFRDGRSLRNVDYWISYSYLDTERSYRDFPYRAAPAFTSRHNFSAVYKHFIPAIRSQVGATYSFASGRPFNDPNEDDFNGQRTPSYHDLSANISYLPTNNIIIHASITNILKRENIFGYEYRPDKNNEGSYENRAVKLPAPRFILLGVFITLSKSKTVNQLPHL